MVNFIDINATCDNVKGRKREVTVNEEACQIPAIACTGTWLVWLCRVPFATSSFGRREICSTPTCSNLVTLSKSMEEFL